MIITDFGVAVIENDSHLSKWIVEQRRLDVAADYCQLFKKYIPEGGTVVDVGACLGDHTMTYAQMVGGCGRVLAFEPHPEMFKCLRRNMEPFPQVQCIEIALGATDGFGYMRPSAREPHNFGAEWFKPHKIGNIPMNPLDSWKLIRLDFMKIDVEGLELDVLLGAVKTIKACRPVMLIEINRPLLMRRAADPDVIFRMLRDHGYDVQPSEPHVPLESETLDILALP